MRNTGKVTGLDDEQKSDTLARGTARYIRTVYTNRPGCTKANQHYDLEYAHRLI